MCEGIQVIDLEEYLGVHGCASPVNSFMIDKMKLPHGETARQKRHRMKMAEEFSVKYHDLRSKCIQEYQDKVKQGVIRPCTSIERSLIRANGHEDLESTHAARRMLAKRGIDWKTGKCFIPGNRKEITHDVSHSYI